MKKLIIAVVAAVVPLIAFAAPASASNGVYHQGQCWARGGDASCNTDPTWDALRPANAHAHVTVSPGAKVFLDWDIVCTAKSGAVASNDGSVTLKSPFSHELPLPMIGAASCDIFAGAAINSGSGSLHLWVTYRR